MFCGGVCVRMMPCFWQLATSWISQSLKLSMIPNRPCRTLAIAPIICVPTTAGTGSEVTIGAVISDHGTHHKYAITAPCVTPKAAILDPELTVSMPPFITATTGVDALTHAVESYVTCMYNTDKTNK